LELDELDELEEEELDEFDELGDGELLEGEGDELFTPPGAYDAEEAEDPWS
jgi:hypothetical protein